MAMFNIKNNELSNFAKCNHMVLHKKGVFSFDETDYLSIVEHGTTEYFFAHGDTFEKAIEVLKSKFNLSKKAKKIFVGIEISAAESNASGVEIWAKLKQILDQIDDLILEPDVKVSMENSFNVYLDIENGINLHVLANFR